MAVNLCCFIIISVNYGIIFIKTKISARSIDNSQNRSFKMEAKITAIILTDFICWIPLAVVCFLHFGEVIDATTWYPLFSTILLPLNSVINPILYNSKIERIMLYPARCMINGAQRLIGSLRNTISMLLETREAEPHVQFEERPAQGPGPGLLSMSWFMIV